MGRMTSVAVNYIIKPAIHGHLVTVAKVIALCIFLRILPFVKSMSCESNVLDPVSPPSAMITRSPTRDSEVSSSLSSSSQPEQCMSEPDILLFDERLDEAQQWWLWSNHDHSLQAENFSISQLMQSFMRSNRAAVLSSSMSCQAADTAMDVDGHSPPIVSFNDATCTGDKVLRSQKQREVISAHCLYALPQKADLYTATS